VRSGFEPAAAWYFPFLGFSFLRWRAQKRKKKKEYHSAEG
jgi:hypothetical protein